MVSHRNMDHLTMVSMTINWSIALRLERRIVNTTGHRLATTKAPLKAGPIANMVLLHLCLRVISTGLIHRLLVKIGLGEDFFALLILGTIGVHLKLMTNDFKSITTHLCQTTRTTVVTLSLLDLDQV
jgi:hypothetical protein